MNALPPPSFPPEPPSTTAPKQPRRRGAIIGLAVLGGAALLAGGVGIGVAIASDDGQDDGGAPDVDLAVQLDEDDIASWFEELSPFVDCVTSEIDIENLPGGLDDLGTLDDLSEITADDLERLWDEGLAVLEEIYVVCVGTLPGDLADHDFPIFDLDEFESDFNFDDHELWGEFDLGEFSPDLLDEMLGDFLEDTINDGDLQNWLDEIRDELPPELADLLDD